MNKTIAQQLNVTKFPFTIKDDNGNEIYVEDSRGYWTKYEYNDKGNLIYSEGSDGYWRKWEYDDKGKEIYSNDSNGYWSKNKYDDKELEEAAEKLFPTCTTPLRKIGQKGFIAGAEWQAERSYSEEETSELVYNIIGEYAKHYCIIIDGAELNDLFEKFKKK